MVNPAVEWPKGDGEKSVVLPNERDKFFMRLESFKKNNLTAKEESEVGFHIEQLYSSLHELAWNIFGLNEKQLKLLEISELWQLDEEIYKRAKTIGLAQSLCFAAFPILGWIYFFTQFKPLYYWSYKYQREKLRKYLKDEVFYARILEYIRERE